MNDKTKTAVTKALDTSIVSAAEERLEILKPGFTGTKAAKEVYSTLDSFRDLGQNIMPSYNAWDALLYCLWYQPSQINLAYTLARQIPRQQSPLRNGSGSLQVFDFGCGALAMKFGLALAAADTLEEFNSLPRIAINSSDTSGSMLAIGRLMWRHFLVEISDEKQYPELKALRQVCHELEVGKLDYAPDTSWLTALHVAYKDNPEANAKLAVKNKQINPDVILATTYPKASKWLYSPENPEYMKRVQFLLPKDLAIEGGLDRTTSFRRNLFNDRFFGQFNVLDETCKEFVRHRLTEYPTRMASPIFRSICVSYTKP